MSYFNDLILEIDRGRAGDNEGLEMGLSRLSHVLGHLQPSNPKKYLIGANTGVGKTYFVDYNFVLKPIENLIKDSKAKEKYDFTALYFSMEVSRKRKLVKWAALKLWTDYRILIDSKELLSFGKEKLDDNIYKLLMNMEGYFEELEKYVIIHEGKINPTGIHRAAFDFAEKVGKFDNYEVKLKNGYTKKEKKYTKNNPNHIVEVIIDHLGLMKGEHEKDVYLTGKPLIDKHSGYGIEYRDLLNFNVIDISQFNRSIADMGRKRYGNLSPQLEDRHLKSSLNRFKIGKSGSR